MMMGILMMLKWIIWQKNKDIQYKFIYYREELEMTEREKLALLEDMLELDEGDLTVDKALDDIDDYNSMAKLSLIVLMEDEFGVKLTGDVIKGFKTVGDIVAMMNK